MTMSTARGPFVRVEDRGLVAEVTLARPPVNAVNQEMYREIEEVFGRRIRAAAFSMEFTRLWM